MFTSYRRPCEVVAGLPHGIKVSFAKLLKVVDHAFVSFLSRFVVVIP